MHVVYETAISIAFLKRCQYSIEMEYYIRTSLTIQAWKLNP